MVLLLDFSSRGVWVRYFMQSWFLLVPTPQPPALCHICQFCPFQSYLVSGGPSGSMSHPPPPGPRMPLPWPPCCLGEYNACIERHRVHRAFSLSELLHGWGYKLFAWSCHGQALLQWNHPFFPPGGPLSMPHLRQQESEVDFLSD